MRSLLVMATVLVATIASAAEPQQIIVWKLDAGYYVVSGSQIVAFPPGSPVVPPIVPPVVPPINEQAKALLKAAVEAQADPSRAATAANLEAVATLLQQQIEKGTLKDYTSISEAYAYLSEQMVPRTGKAAWAPFQALVGDHLAALAQDGVKPAAYAAYFGVVADALDASVPQAEKIQSIDMDTLMKLLEFFMKYILPLIIS